MQRLRRSLFVNRMKVILQGNLKIQNYCTLKTNESHKMCIRDHLKMRHFYDLSQTEQQDFINSLDFVLSDCNGVLWHGKTNPRCGEVMNKFRKLGKKVVLITNNGFRSKEKTEDLLKSAKMDRLFSLNDVVNQNDAIVKYLRYINFKKKLYVICSQPLLDVLDDAGFQYDNGSKMVSSRLEEQHFLDPEVGAVIVDIDVDVNYMKIAKAIHYLQQPHVLFLTGGVDNWGDLPPKMRLLGPGYFLDIIKQATNRNPKVFCKPGDALGEILKVTYGIKDPRRVLFIGDKIDSDIVFANKQGFCNLLVLTGKTDKKTADVYMQSKGNDKRSDEELDLLRPEFFLESLADLTPVLDKMLNL